MINLFVVAIDPKITCNNASGIPKETGIQEALDYRVIVLSKRAEGFLNRSIEIIDPVVEDLNIDKLVGPVGNRALRHAAFLRWHNR